MRQISSHIPAPFRTQFAQWCDPQCPQRDQAYSLFGIIMHTGSSSFGGHYTAYVRTARLGEDGEHEWVLLDDDLAKAFSQAAVAQRMSPLSISFTTSFLLFYARDEE